MEPLKKYDKLRNENYDYVCFFVRFKAGKCTKQLIGINTIGNMPKLIIRFFELPNPNAYIGYCLHGGWNSISVGECYMETST